MQRQIAITKAEPRLAAQFRESLHELPCFTGPAPASRLIAETRKCVQHGIEVGADMEANMVEIVADVHNNSQSITQNMLKTQSVARTPASGGAPTIRCITKLPTTTAMSAVATTPITTATG